MRKWQRASTSGLADCRLQEGRELEIGKIASAGFLMCLSYLTCLACWLFSLLYAAICFFLYCASLWVTLYDTIHDTCLDMGGKRKDLGIGREGFLDGAQLAKPGVGNALKTGHGHILHFFTTYVFQ